MSRHRTLPGPRVSSSWFCVLCFVFGVSRFTEALNAVSVSVSRSPNGATGGPTTRPCLKHQELYAVTTSNLREVEKNLVAFATKWGHETNKARSLCWLRARFNRHNQRDECKLTCSCRFRGRRAARRALPSGCHSRRDGPNLRQLDCAASRPRLPFHAGTSRTTCCTAVRSTGRPGS